jgi:hypothetical protein
VASIIFATVDKVVEDSNTFILTQRLDSYPRYVERYGHSNMTVFTDKNLYGFISKLFLSILMNDSELIVGIFKRTQINP